MTSTGLVRYVFAALAFACVFAAPAIAQTSSANIAPPPEKFHASPGGVDMRSGKYMYSQTDLTVPGGLDLTRTMTQQVVAHNNPFANFSHNWDVMVAEKRIDILHGQYTNGSGQDYQIEFAFGGRSQTFRAFSAETFEQSSRGAYVVLSYSAPGGDRSSASTVYTLQTADGTTAVFRSMGSADCSAYMRCAYISQMTNADGTFYSFEYDATGGANTSRLRSITSNRGYAMLFEYSGSLVVKSCVINLTLTIKPATNICPAGVPTATYTYDAAGGETRLASVTDPGGGVWGFVNTPTTIGFKKPGQATPWLINTFHSRLSDDGLPEQIVDSQSVADGQSYSYTWVQAPFVPGHVSQIAGGTFTNAQGRVVTVQYDFPLKPHQQQGFGNVPCECAQDTNTDVLQYQITPGPIAVTDEIGRTTITDYCDPYAAANLQPNEQNRCIVGPVPFSTTDPGGFRTDMVWDISTRNLGQVTRHATTGSGLSDVVMSAGYNCLLSTIRFCNKPTLVTDARNNSTTYTYDPAHGGVLTETLPPPAPGAPQPQKRYSYAQRYAWVSNGAGGYVHAASQIWVLTQMSFCKSGAPASGGTGCATGGDEVITTYDYGPDSGPNNLLLRGTLVDAGGLSLRTCMAYDAYGNKISETKPRAGLTSCP
jgi:hypothetical protein